MDSYAYSLLNSAFFLVGILQMFVHTSAMTDPHRLPLWYLVYLFILCFHVSFLFAISPSPSLIRISHPFVTASQGPPHLVLFFFFHILFIIQIIVCMHIRRQFCTLRASLSDISYFYLSFAAQTSFYALLPNHFI